ncbi:hypothetical protein BDV93DRAFT_525852, partial [Ceratobasidium sp. AG-I]
MSRAQETNNQGAVCIPGTTIASVPAGPYTRDPKYYCDDNIILLVGDALFKFSKSILLSHMDEESYLSAKIAKLDLDCNPFVVSVVTVQQFRWFLLLMLGTPADPEYKSLFVSTKSTGSHTKDDFLCHLGIYIIVRYFGMSKLRTWSHSQLDVILRSATGFVNASWDSENVNQVVTCAFEENNWLSYDLRAFILLALSTSVPNNPLAYKPPLSYNLDACVALYKDPKLPQTHPSLFGYVFAVILSLGRRSPVWTGQLTQEDRTVLNAAQVDLTSLGNDPELALSWLSQLPSQNWSWFCNNSCAKAADTAWRASFARCGVFDSAVPLVDISKLILLPGYRQLFVDTAQSNPHSCPCDSEDVLFSIDGGIELIFTAMCGKYQYFVT